MNLRGLTPYGYSGDLVATGSWQRFTFTHSDTRTNAGTTDLFGIIGNVAGVQSDILIWGAQAELGTYSTSYIPTTTTGVLRNADVLTAGDMVTDAAGSAYSEVSSIWPTAPSGSLAYALSRNGGGIMYALTSFRITSEGSYSPIGATFYNRLAPAASTWGTASGIVTAYKDGLPDPTPAAYGGTFGTGNLSIGSNHVGAYQWDGTVREVKIFNSELTAAEVGDL